MGTDNLGYPDPLIDFQETQWWVQELKKLAQHADATPGQRRSVFVVLHMLLSARKAEQEITSLQTALRDLLTEVKKVPDVLMPDSFNARVFSQAEDALATVTSITPRTPENGSSSNIKI